MILGCGGPEQIAPLERAAEGSPEQLKRDLQVIAESGTGDSALQPIIMGMEALDPAFPRKEELQAVYKKLLAAKSPEQRKKLSEEMIVILNET